MSERKSTPERSVPSARTVHRGPRDDRGVIADRILSVARTSFSQHGYAGTSMRSIAREADFDPALINYYFKSKTGLLDAALVAPAARTDALAAAAATPIKHPGAELFKTLVAAWEDPAIAEFLRSAILAAAHEPIALQRLATNFTVYILDPVSSKLDDEERFVRASLISTQMVGLAIIRYVWKLGAVAAMPPHQVVELIAPTIQKYLNGRLRA